MGQVNSHGVEFSSLQIPDKIETQIDVGLTPPDVRVGFILLHSREQSQTLIKELHDYV